MTNRHLPVWANEATAAINVQYGFPIRPEYHAASEVASACPFCKTGEDRFIIFEEGNFWCRVCGKTGWWRSKLNTDEIEATKQRKEEQRKATTQLLARCNDWKTYHKNVYEHLTDWEPHGIDQRDIDRWQLGWAPATSYWKLPSLTIPVFFKGLLVDIRHRLLGDVPDKYRSHFKDTPPAFFNGDAVLTNQKIFLVEGEKKAIILEKHGITPAISYPGVNMQDALIAFLHDQGSTGQELIYIPDPNTIDTILVAGRELKAHNRNVSVVELFMKPDDMLLRYGAKPLKDAISRKQRI